MSEQLFNANPENALAKPVDCCLRHAGRQAGYVWLIASAAGMWVAVRSASNRASWARQISAGENIGEALGAVMGFLPTAETMEFLAFRPIDFDELSAFLDRAPGKPHAVKDRYVVFHGQRQVMHAGTLKAAQDYVGKSPANVQAGLRISKVGESAD